MSTVAKVAIHTSQFPESVRRDLLKSLRTRQVNHKFHYESLRQTQQWLALHRAWAPSETDRAWAETYDAAFQAMAGEIEGRRIQCVGLCCGDGLKEARLLRALKSRKKQLSYVPADGSVIMALTASEAARRIVPEEARHPLVCDLQTVTDLPRALGVVDRARRDARVVAFFGTLHNYPPKMIIARLASLLARGDRLVFSTNLAPEAGYDREMKRLRRQYDNPMTHDWLCLFLSDLGVAARDGKTRTVVEPCPSGSGLQRIAVYFEFSRRGRLTVAGEVFHFRPGQRIRLFYSYRYTPERVAKLFGRQGLEITGQWLSDSREEGVFLGRRK